MHKQIIPFLFLIGIMLQSCGNEYAYQREYEIQEMAWAYTDTLNFNFAIEDTLTLYNLYLQIEHTQDYAYQNLYAKISTKFPEGELLEEVLSLELADKTGNWEGQCSGGVCKLTIPIQENAYFNKNGEYQITIEQFMRKSPLAGIRKIGFSLEKTVKPK